MGLQTDAQRRWWFANMHLSEAADRIDARGQKALRGYKNFGYSMVNKRLRDKTTGLGDGADRDADAMVSDLDHAMSQSQLASDVIVYRGFEHKAAAKHPQRLVGSTIESPAFLSTSFDKDVVSDRFMQSKDAIGLRLRVPRGTRAVATEKFANLHESEVLLQRGLKVRVKGVTYYKGKPYLDAEVVR